jgi:hypothetical protein
VTPDVTLAGLERIVTGPRPLRRPGFPAVMQELGRRNWWQPAALERSLPQLHIEGRPDTFLGLV